MSEKSDYVRAYYESYAASEIDEETKVVGSFLAENVSGITLDCGCGPVPQIWAIFMPRMTELYAIDLPQESVDFVKEKLADATKWINDFSQYQKATEVIVGPQSKNYILQQVKKIKDVLQADMTTSLPFSDKYFDTVISLYSLGCLKNEQELDQAIMNIKRALKPGGRLLHINTDGENANNILPAYTWRGLSRASATVERFLEKHGFQNIFAKQISLQSDSHGMYRYASISLLSATNSE